MPYGKRIFIPAFVRPITVYIAAPALFTLFALAIAIPISSSPVYADHDSMYVECPEAIPEGEWGWMRFRKPGYKLNYVTVFTYNGSYTASGNDYYEYHGERLESRTGENSIWVPVGALEDTNAEHDETFAIGGWYEGLWHGCVVTIEDDDAPAITGVEISSTPRYSHAYRAGEDIDVTVHTDFEVEVEGTPLLSLYIGDSEGTTWRGAKYHSGSGSRALVFRHEVQPKDLDIDGISVSRAASADDGTPAYGFSGNIYAEGTDVPIDYSHSGVEGGINQQVDGRPHVQSARITSSPPDGWQAYRANQTIEVSLEFSIDVVVEGEVTVDLRLGLDGDNYDEATKKARYLRGSGTETLVFGYTVRPGDMDPKGVKIAVGIVIGSVSSGFGGSGTIKAEGTDVERDPFYYGTGHLPEHKVDTEPPSVSSVAFTSRPANGEAYVVGEVVRVEVAFSEEVTPEGDPHIELDVGGEVREASLCAVPIRQFGNSLFFEYIVQNGDADADGIGIDANSLVQNNGGVYDIAGNAAALSHDTVVASSAQRVEASSED